ncbi:MAG: S8/S53 family peptidase [Deltaproteobacteria bacterium]|nr:S8/S53 family peptidase [Deltaproteobacteria bacterium]
MCRFVPGQVLAIGPLHALREMGNGLPGSTAIDPFVPENADVEPDSPFQGLGVLVLTTDPGLELLALSRLSAQLAGAINRKQAVVDLNHLLPLGSAPYPTNGLRLSPRSEREVQALRQFVRARWSGSPGTTTRVAVIDSGLHPDFAPHRSVTYLDYTAATVSLEAPRADPLGHGTRVVKLLDELLPMDVELVVGRLPGDSQSVTVLGVARAFGDLVARTKPDVVNLSLALRDDAFTCPACRKRVPVPGFVPSFFPMLVSLAGRCERATVTVLAAGNSGQVSNSRWVTPDTDAMVIAIAENRHGDRARYSGAPTGPLADLLSASAFGGDDPDETGFVGVFEDGGYGTSFAAPFLSAAALLARQRTTPMPPHMPPQLGLNIRHVLAMARRF